MLTIYDILLLPFIIIASMVLSFFVGRALELNYRLCFKIFIWHTAFSVIYWLYSLNNVADSNSYYEAGLVGDFNWFPGTRFVESFTSIFANILGFGKINTFLVYNLVGVLGLLLLAHVLLNLWPTKRGRGVLLPYFLLFMPGLSFWSSAIGKDAPAFFAASLATYAFQNIGHRTGVFIIATLCMFTVRPHVAVFMVFAAGIALLTGRHIRLISRLFIFFMLSILLFVSLPFVVTYVGLSDDVSYQDVSEYVEQRQGYNLEGGSSIDISALPLPLKMFTYIFRPLFFDAPGLLGIAASIENLMLILLFLFFVVRAFAHILLTASVNVRYNLAFFCIGLFVFSITTANIGIALRQKTMILPSLFFLIAFSARELQQHVKLSKR